jgi:hypothetical protein
VGQASLPVLVSRMGRAIIDNLVEEMFGRMGLVLGCRPTGSGAQAASPYLFRILCRLCTSDEFCTGFVHLCGRVFAIETAKRNLFSAWRNSYPPVTLTLSYFQQLRDGTLYAKG